jgi:Na+/H+ antiporter NhaD/arsenite permease-like protein
MTYLHMLAVAATWIGFFASALVLLGTALFMVLGLCILSDSSRKDRRDIAILWAIGVPVLFFGIPAWILWGNAIG